MSKKYKEELNKIVMNDDMKKEYSKMFWLKIKMITMKKKK
ncbi:hypothetical protein BJV40_001973 [Clostridium beijerinckii]|nr:hypothetical protein [Clostridium beijerinckii]